jgi:hypothetical protein
MSPEIETLDSNPPTGPAARPGRRAFLSNAALAAAGVAAAGLLAPKAAMAVTPALTFAQIPGTGDTKVLNYALALEALEAELYRQAVARLTTGGTDNLGNKFSGLEIDPKERLVGFVQEFGKVEVEHRNFLNAALGKASLLNTPTFKNVKFDFGISKLDGLGVLSLVYTAEKTGVGAYLGAIDYLATKDYLQIAGAILGVEARHTAVIADTIQDFYPSAAASVEVAPSAAENGGKDVAVSPDKVLAAVSPFIIL